MSREQRELLEEGGSANTVGELWAFLAKNKKWWLLPVIVLLLGLGMLIIVGGTGAAPFIYTLF